MEQYKDKEWLRDKYWNNRLTIYDMGKLCHCSGETIRRWMIKYDIPRRTGKNIIDLDFSNLETLSYILGVLDSDGYIYFNRGSGHLSLNVSDKMFADSFYDSLESIGLHPNQHIRKLSVQDQYYVQACSAQFYRWYNSLDDLKKRDLVGIYPREYLCGFYEGDGTQNDSYIGFVNTDLDLIELIESLLDDLGFEHSRWVQEYGDEDLKTEYTINILGGPSERNRFLNEVEPSIKNRKYRE